MNHKIQRLLKEANCPVPEFEFGSFFTIIFKREKKKLGESSQKSSQKILSLLKQNPNFSAMEIAKEIGLTHRAVQKQIAILKANGKLERIGSAKGGHWEVVKK